MFGRHGRLIKFRINTKNQDLLACREEAELNFEGGSHESLFKAELSPTRGQRNSRGAELLALIETQPQDPVFFSEHALSRHRPRSHEYYVCAAWESSAFGLLRGYEMLRGSFEGLPTAKSG